MAVPDGKLLPLTRAPLFQLDVGRLSPVHVCIKIDEDVFFLEFLRLQKTVINVYN